MFPSRLIALESSDPPRYLTKLCDQIVCLLSSEHSQAIVWGGEYDVAKTDDEEDNVVARPGFTVHFFVKILSLELTSTLLISEDGFSASCRSTASAWDLCRP